MPAIATTISRTGANRRHRVKGYCRAPSKRLVIDECSNRGLQQTPGFLHESYPPGHFSMITNTCRQRSARLLHPRSISSAHLRNPASKGDCCASYASMKAKKRAALLICKFYYNDGISAHGDAAITLALSSRPQPSFRPCRRRAAAPPLTLQDVWSSNGPQKPHSSQSSIGPTGLSLRNCPASHPPVPRPRRLFGTIDLCGHNQSDFFLVRVTQDQARRCVSELGWCLVSI